MTRKPLQVLAVAMTGVGVMLVLAALATDNEVAAFPYSYYYSKPQYEVQIVSNGVPVREYYHNGRYYVMGGNGDRYAIRVRNNTGRRVEVVATVDGLDVVDGKQGNYSKRGYVLQPYQTYDIDGFRVNMNQVAAFRFSSVGESYAAKTGSARNVGVIGVAFFAERYVPPPPPPRPYAPRAEESGRWGGLHSTGPAPAKSAPPTSAAQPGAGGYDRSASEAAAPAEKKDSRGDTGAYYRPGLGTEFGEARNSSVRETSFVRASFNSPTQLVAVYYNDRAGLTAMGVPVDSPPPDEVYQRNTANPFPSNPPRRDFARPPDGWQP